MTIYKIRYIATILFIISPFVAFAQQQAGDSISIFELIDAVEKSTSCRIYTTIAEPFKVKKAETLKPTAESLRQALTGTRYKVTVYGKQIFVLPEAFLSTTLIPILKGEQMKKEEQVSSFIPVVKSSSENKVYEIGDRYKPSLEEMVVLTGKVTDFKSGQNLEGINIVHREPWAATATDRQGNFTIKLPVGYNTIEINGLNIKETRRQFMVYGEGATHIELEEENHLLDEVVIVSGRVQNVRSTQLGMEKFQPSLLKNIPTAMGEVDLLKMLQTLPGIKTVGEASSGYNVRGSAADQNLLLLNNGTIYNPNHLFGFFTAFNSDMIKDAELYKSSIPSQYGGRIASVLNITSKEASKEKFASVKAGFNTMRQYIHKVSNTTIMSPTDTWKLSDTNIKPQNGWQLAAGAYYNTPGQVLELSVEGYYKKLNDYLDYRSSAKLVMNHHLETDVINTEGYAYGVELQVKKPSGKLNGWASYTYSRTFLRQNDPRIARPVNGGDWYPTEYDKPHDFKLVGNYKFTRRYSVSFNMDYSTGRPTTIPAGQYYDQGLQSMQVYYTDRNSYRVPDYFRLDLAFNIEPSHHLTLLTHSSISFGVYNLTGRKNVYSIYYVSENGRVQGYKMSIFGAPIPFITYNIKF